ncbi:amidohydrolase [Spirillospora sp. CA-128828]|uniref:amidohydrolase n=1 Tax=Spirillospora sp. CA-128828 TaxID=3240033 RepID=UPI003D8EEB0E
MFALNHGLLDPEEARDVIEGLVAAARQWQPPELDGSPTDAQFVELFGGFMSPAMVKALWDFRRYVHRHPEVAENERNTTRLVFAVLRAVGLKPRYVLDNERIGVICDIDPEQSPKYHGEQLADSGKWLVLRTELDALPYQDETTTDYRSVLEEAVHACGHDVHLTIMLAGTLFLNLLNMAGILRRRVRFLGQHGEETAVGAELAILAGAIDLVSHVIALHCESERPAGQIGLLAGEITSSCDFIDLEVSGPGGHTGHPDLTVNTVKVADEAALKLAEAAFQLVGGRYEPLVFGTAHGGTTRNAIPKLVVKAGTLRLRTEEEWLQASAVLEQVRQQLADKYPQATVVLTIKPVVSPTVNHESTVRLVKKFAAVAGFETGDAEQSGGGEDLCHYLREVPGALIRLGVLPPDMAEWPPLHDSKFDVIKTVFEEIVPKGAGLVSAVAVLG